MTIPSKLPEIKIPDVASDPGLQQWLNDKKNVASFLKQYPDVSNYLKKKKLKKTVANITQATNAVRAQKRAELLPKGRDISGVSADAARLVIYGECVVGGVITFIDSRGNNQYLDLIVSIAAHKIDSVQKLILDNEYEVVFNTGSDGWAKTIRNRVSGEVVTAVDDFIFMRVATGADDQSAILDLAALNPKWSADHKQSGVAHAYIILVWNAEIFGDGLPEISFQVRGKEVYDPRVPENRYTATASLCIADYLTNTRYGMGIPYSRIDETSLIAAANVDDELVDLQGGGQEYRYTINGYFEMGGQTHVAVLERMCAAMGGSINYANGKWTFWPAKWRTPVIDITEDDLRGPIKMQTMVSRDAIFNCVKGKFISSAQRYIETDYPAVKNSTYMSLDGEEITQYLDFPFVITAATCQRLAKLELERNRQGIQIEIVVSLKVYQVLTNENITITLSRYGWVAKPFEVVACDFILSETNDSPEVLVQLSLRETAEGVFTWNYWEETTVDVAPNTNLPSPFSSPTISGLALESGTTVLYIRGDGTIAPRIKVSWSALTDFFLTSGGKIEIQFKKSEDSLWIDSNTIPGSSTTTYVTDVQDGVYYDVRARAVNAFGYPSEWAEVVNHFVVGKTAPPSDVTGFDSRISDYGISLAWNKVGDLDLKEYEIREGSSWDSADIISRVKSTSINLNIRAAGTYTFLIKAIDTSENYSTNADSEVVTIIPPTVSSASFSIQGTDVSIDWAEAILGSWAIDTYDIYYGDVFATSTFLLSTKATAAKFTVSWLGNRRFWIVAHDIYGNTSTEISLDVTVSGPNPVINFIASVIDNNVLAKWFEPTASTLPIVKYVIKKGAVYGSAETIGEVFGTFTVLFELLSGTYTYWIEAVDSAGNHGSPLGTTVNVNEPPDFQLIATVTLEDGDTLTNCREDPSGIILGPINTDITWEDHFAVQGWSTPQDQITAGFPIFIQPTKDYARWEKIHDLGVEVNNVLIHLVYTRSDISGTGPFTPKIAYSEDNVTYTEESNVAAVLAPAVRYIRIRMDFGTVP